jgi:hypothetical protein
MCSAILPSPRGAVDIEVVRLQVLRKHIDQRTDGYNFLHKIAGPDIIGLQPPDKVPSGFGSI